MTAPSIEGNKLTTIIDNAFLKIIRLQFRLFYHCHILLLSFDNHYDNKLEKVKSKSNRKHLNAFKEELDALIYRIKVNECIETNNVGNISEDHHTMDALGHQYCCVSKLENSFINIMVETQQH